MSKGMLFLVTRKMEMNYHCPLPNMLYQCNRHVQFLEYNAFVGFRIVTDLLFLPVLNKSLFHSRSESVRKLRRSSAPLTNTSRPMTFRGSARSSNSSTKNHHRSPHVIKSSEDGTLRIVIRSKDQHNNSEDGANTTHFIHKITTEF